MKQVTSRPPGGTSSGESGGRGTGNARAARIRKTFGYFEGNPATVSGETISRQLCDAGYRGILFSQAGQPLNVGREQRLFNREQRRALAVRDGGCRWPDCEQPSSWTEAHHIENWLDLGLSNIDHAILFCAHHHLLLHNRHWKVLMLNDQYWLQPPVEIDLEQALIALPSKNPLMDVPVQLDGAKDDDPSG
ncbi:HNH endonuclease signature motif containing protein [Cryobacterium sp. Y82]|uniref:HNH endonuclease signature motif containing protein n=1 Tax=Cryobacterium sp. Y82 TaxID=2045017 RepID=UPI0011B0F1C1|nr:HNH endonuclease signature motif containing protein [Cryobacterium sp. Y82]